MNKKKLNVLFFSIIVLIFVLSAYWILVRKNTEIANLRKFMKAPNQEIIYIENDIYNFVNKHQKEQKYTARVRDNSYKEEKLYNDKTSVDFIVDISSHQISYKVSSSWPRDKQDIYQISINCLSKKDLIFPEKECNGTDYDYSQLKLMEKYPIYEKLPITYEKYNFNSRSTTKYKIEGYFDDEKYIIVIKDYSGDNKERALEHIKSLGYNPEDYIIKYKF